MLDAVPVFLFAVLLLFFGFDIATCSVGSCREHQFRLLSQICIRDEGQRRGVVIEHIRAFVRSGHLSKARRIAYECLALLRGNEQYNADAKTFAISHCCPTTEEEVVRAYKSSMDKLFQDNDNFINIIAEEKHRYNIDHDDPSSRPPGCWDGRDSFQVMSSDVGTGAGVDFISFGNLGIDNNIIDLNTSPGSAAIDRWNDCCSFFKPCNEEYTCFDKSNGNALCCELSEGLDNHLILPALREPAVTASLKLVDYSSGKETLESIEVDQEGSLRMFDVSGVLWPAGYLLGLCLSNPVACRLPEVLDAINFESCATRPLVVELGAGTGFPSIAFAKAAQYQKRGTCITAEVCDQYSQNNLPIIVATDTSNTSLALIRTNALKNGVGNLVKAVNANHTDSASLSFLSSDVDGAGIKDGFDIVMGSSLQALFDGTSQHSATLWHSLDALLSKENDNAVVVLSHVRTGDEQIKLPPASERLFECVRRVSGDQFGMKTRDGQSSDFELVLLKRR